MTAKSTENDTIRRIQHKERRPSKEVDHLFIEHVMELAIRNYNEVSLRPTISKEEARRNLKAGVKRLFGHRFRQKDLVKLLKMDPGYISRRLRRFFWLQKEPGGIWEVKIEPRDLIEYYPEMKQRLSYFQSRYWPKKEPTGFVRWYWSDHDFKKGEGPSSGKLITMSILNIHLIGKETELLYRELEKRKVECMKKRRITILKEALEAVIAEIEKP